METSNIIEAIPAGAVITNASKWKSGAATLNYVSLMLAPIFAWLQVKYPSLIFDEATKIIIYNLVISAILGINVWISKMTTSKPVSVAELVK